MTTKPLLFDATDGNSAIYRRMLSTDKYEEGRLVRQVFGDGEIGHRIQPDLGNERNLATTLNDREVVIVGDLSHPVLIADSWDVPNVAHDEWAANVTLVVPRSSLPTDQFQRRALLNLFASMPQQNPGDFKLALVDSDMPSASEFVPLKRWRKRTSKSASNLFGESAKPILLYTSSYEYLAREMMDYGDFELGEFKTTELDGRPFFSKLITKVAGRRVVIASGTIDARETMEQYYLGTAIAREGALVGKFIEAYASVQTSDRKTLSGEAVKAKIRARLLSSMPACEKGDQVIFFDLHNEANPYKLEGGIRSDHGYYAKHLVAAHARTMLGMPSTDVLGTITDLAIEGGMLLPLTVSATDKGRSPWAQSIGIEVRLESASGDKVRLGDGNVIFRGAHGKVQGRNVLVLDDKNGTGTTVGKATYGIRIAQYGQPILESLGIVFDEEGRVVPEKSPKWIVLDPYKTDGIDTSNKPDLSHVPIYRSDACFSHVPAGPAVAPKMKKAQDILGRPLFTHMIGTNSCPNVRKYADGDFYRYKTVAKICADKVAR